MDISLPQIIASLLTAIVEGILVLQTRLYFGSLNRFLLLLLLLLILESFSFGPLIKDAQGKEV